MVAHIALRKTVTPAWCSIFHCHRKSIVICSVIVGVVIVTLVVSQFYIMFFTAIVYCSLCSKILCKIYDKKCSPCMRLLSQIDSRKSLCSRTIVNVQGHIVSVHIYCQCSWTDWNSIHSYCHMLLFRDRLVCSHRLRKLSAESYCWQDNLSCS